MPNWARNAPRRAIDLARGFARRYYHRFAALNYATELYARRNRTPAGTVHSYEPCNRHGSDGMLAELDAACSSDAVIVDAGAHAGLYALSLAIDAPDRRVVAFEPAPGMVERLRTNLRRNGLEERIDVRPCALGEADGERPFYRSTNPELSAFDRAAASRWGGTVRDVRSVPVRRLDSLVADSESSVDDDPLRPPTASHGPCPPPDAVKIDVEGAAPAVLRGARATLERHQPLVLLEIHTAGLEGETPGETKGVLDDCGYEIRERDGYWRCEPVE